MGRKKPSGPSVDWLKDEWLGDVAHKKKRGKEKKEAKAKRKAKIQAQDNARRKAGQIAFERVRDAREAVKDFKRMPSSEKTIFFDFSDQALVIREEVFKLYKEVIDFWIHK